MQSLLERTGVEQPVTVLYDNNQAAIAMSKTPCHCQRSKHICSCFHFVLECCIGDDIKLVHVCTDWNVTDAFTKPLPETAFVRLTRVMHSELETTTTHRTTTMINTPRI